MIEERPITINVDNLTLAGALHIPEHASGVVIFAHGSGSSRFSPRNQYVAKTLHAAKIGTLLFDLLSKEEEQIDNRTRELRFNIPLLASRLIVATETLLAEPAFKSLKIGYFGASTGAAAALMAAAHEASIIQAVVSRGGRPDLAGAALAKVKAPSLLIVGSLDTDVIALNKKAMASLNCTHRLEIVPGASHLFEEPGTLDKAAALSNQWFTQYLS